DDLANLHMLRVPESFFSRQLLLAQRFAAEPPRISAVGSSGVFGRERFLLRPLKSFKYSSRGRLHKLLAILRRNGLLGSHAYTFLQEALIGFVRNPTCPCDPNKKGPG